VKRLTGTLTLAVDGKVDASNRSDMLTQKLLGTFRCCCTTTARGRDHRSGERRHGGLGPDARLERVDVVEISPEVVEASRFFVGENRHALDDPRAHLIVGDGRSHLLLTSRQYDVIISEPSNPWIAGVAALFTREFFEAAKARLTPGGLICQWAHTYNIADADLRSIVGTFTAVFPNGTLWLIGGDDVLLVASNDGGDGRRAPGQHRTKLDSTGSRRGSCAGCGVGTIFGVVALRGWSTGAGGLHRRRHGPDR
jgi:spermidine synthase